MRESLLYIWARRIHACEKSIGEFETKFGREETNRLYLVLFDLYGDRHEPLVDPVFIIEEM